MRGEDGESGEGVRSGERGRDVRGKSGERVGKERGDGKVVRGRGGRSVRRESGESVRRERERIFGSLKLGNRCSTVHRTLCSNLATLQVHNAMLVVRIVLKQLLLHHSEEEVIVQLDGATTVPQVE